MVFFLLAALTLLVVPATPAAAGPITINTALPVSPGQIIIRGDAFVQRAGTGLFSVNYFCRSATIIFAGCRQVYSSFESCPHDISV